MPERAKRVLVGVTGGIAAYKSAELIRLLVKSAIEVQVVMTDAAKQFITPLTLQALSAKAVLSDLWDEQPVNHQVNHKPNRMAHIELTRCADLILIAPASADFIAKLAHGLCNDLLSTLCVARNRESCPLLVAPAMNREMWENPATQRNLAQLVQDGVVILGPAAGDQACGEVGMGRMLEAEELAAAVHAQRAPKFLSGKRVLVTAGPTYEAIDPVRGITNRSSGKMGYAIAQAALDAGADVTLISGPTALRPPEKAKVVNVQTAEEMYNAVFMMIEKTDYFFSVAAVADYTPKAVNSQKLKKSAADLSVDFVATRDILAQVARLPKPPICIGFAAETQNVIELAEKKRQAKGIPFIVANLAQEAMGADDNEVAILGASGVHPIPRGPKSAVARALVAFVADRISGPARLKSISRSH